MKSSIVLISNPAAKRFSEKKIEKASHFLRSRGYEVEVFSTTRRGDAERLAREALKKSPSLIIAAGGDGTINEVINGIAGEAIPLAILPLGTTNVLAKELGIPENVKGAMEVAVDGTPKIVSLGKIVLTHPSSLITRYFCLMAGIGFDGETVFGIDDNIKKFSGKGAYIYSGMKTLFHFHPNELFFDLDGTTYSGYSAIISKAAKYGGNFKISPDASLADPSFYVCIFKGKNRFDILRYVFGIASRTHLNFKDIEYLKATNIEIKGNAHIQIDGDYCCMTPAKVEVVPYILRLVC
jgi:YegS/Rv2252/BmrU family lipid kinase